MKLCATSATPLITSLIIPSVHVPVLVPISGVATVLKEAHDRRQAARQRLFSS
jgi:hypothetical protein